ncbi:Glyoxalase-like domain protein [Actinomadura rubteroloni]|uniref:Glyoxalase-like domain protein n=1 Tax=Actinomadura rubteroloni TaxID=1926885 RepID=A0A2P4UQ75_9ACTN|nr:VOC family protein [Actinomadura rubteroloni]POM27195.1 Glyoxalase-like domain protein [Actinomadura rubteroloni]
MDVPEHYKNAVIPHIMVGDAAAAIDFYRRAFGASELFRLDGGTGRIVHAEISVAGSTLMLGDPEPPFAPPGATTPVALHVYVPDVDALTERAVAAGAELLAAPADMPYGARQSMLRDPFAHIWIFLTPLDA